MLYIEVVPGEIEAGIIRRNVLNRRETMLIGQSDRPETGKTGPEKTGFTLVEMLVAVFLLAFVMAGVYRTLHTAMRLRTTAHRHYLSVIVANNRIERAKTVGFLELPFLAENEVRVDEQGTPDQEGQFLRSTQVNTNVNDNPDLVQITVTVQPPTYRTDGVRASESVTTLFARDIDL